MPTDGQFPPKHAWHDLYQWLEMDISLLYTAGMQHTHAPSSSLHEIPALEEAPNDTENIGDLWHAGGAGGSGVWLF